MKYLAFMLAISATPVFAEGDAEAGEMQFNRQCVACHVVRNDAGEVLAGRTGRTGPNLFGVTSRTVASAPEFRYGDSIRDLAEIGTLWSEENFVGYVQDPTDWLRAVLDNRRARSKMAYQVRQEQQAYDLFAFLATFEEE